MRFLNIWVKIFTTVLVLNLANGQISTKPFYLTDGQNGVKSIPYRATDQCMAKTDTNNAKTYGLSFRLHSKGGQCDDGLLICYPGMLNRHADSLNFKVKGLFQIDNKKDNMVNQYCLSRMEKEGISAGQTNWRGIKLYTMPNGTQTRDTMLEASIASRPYKLGTNVSQFSIQLGGGNGFTMITVNDEKKPFIDNESNLQKQFREQFWDGAFLREHTGLWMLGLDVLPSMEQENVKLFIDRNCSCTMEAWFTQPTDSVEPKESERPTAGSNNCPIKKIDQTFPINLPGKLPSKIVINARTDVNVNNIVLELFHGDAAGKDGNLLIRFTVGTTVDLKVFLPGTASIGVVKNYRLPKGSNNLLKIYLFGYCYSISLYGNRLGGIYWPKQWWNRKEVKWIKLNGYMVLLEDPRVEYNKTSFPPVNLPKSWPIAGFREHSTFLFRVQLLNPSKGFKIIFSNMATFDEKTNQTAFVVQVVDLKRVELGVYYGGSAHPEQANRKDSSFKAGNAYEFFISVSKSFYGIRLNGENLFENYANSMPFCDIKFVRVEGDAVLLDNPEIYVPPLAKEGGQRCINQK
uniref:Galectin domain-containing protein n=1 Tax=Globodera rostochiensis TaxID=31243 RepID=A0A914H5E4_GLORO